MDIKKSCEECRGNIIKKKVDFKMYGISLGKFPAEVCSKCGEEIFDEETSKKITEIAKKKGLWGLSIKTTVGVVGNSLDIRISKKIADFLHLKKGEEVIVRPENKDRIIIEI